MDQFKFQTNGNQRTDNIRFYLKICKRDTPIAFYSGRAAASSAPPVRRYTVHPSMGAAFILLV